MPRQNTTRTNAPRCRCCSGDALRGWTDGQPHDYCAPCLVASIPNPRVRQRPIGRCACCGRAGPIVALGLRRACYQSRRKRGMLQSWKMYYRRGL